MRCERLRRRCRRDDVVTQGAPGGEKFAGLVVEFRRDGLELFGGPVLRFLTGANAFEDESADNLVRAMEGDAFAGERFGESCRGDPAFIGGGLHAIGVDGCRVDGQLHHGQRAGKVRGGVEDRLFVFLQVAVVSEWESLERHHQREQVACDAARLATYEFASVGVLLLRHEA